LHILSKILSVYADIFSSITLILLCNYMTIIQQQFLHGRSRYLHTVSSNSASNLHDKTADSNEDDGKHQAISFHCQQITLVWEGVGLL